MIEDMMFMHISEERKPAKGRCHWQKPDAGWCKVNTDASFQEVSTLGSGGVVIRDEGGRLLAAMAKSYRRVPDALTAEAMETRDGLIFAGTHGFEKVHLEVDNLPLVNLLRSDRGDLSIVAGLWLEIRELSRSFVSFTFFCFSGKAMRQLMFVLAWPHYLTRLRFGYTPFRNVWRV
jgi:hypothetical protein